MEPNFRTFVTPGFEREVKRLSKNNREALPKIKQLVEVLKLDPLNRQSRYDIKKLKGVKPGAGQTVRGQTAYANPLRTFRLSDLRLSDF